MPQRINIRLTIGIPSEAVYYDPVGLGGGAFSGGVKCEPAVAIDIDTAGAASMAFPVPAWSMTKSFAPSATLTVAGKPDWFRSLKAGSQPTGSATLARTVDNLNARFTVPDGASHGVEFIVVGANPLLSAAPAIDATLTVGLRRKAGKVQYRVTGNHDGFPDYYVFIEAKRVYRWSCVDEGQTPFALFPPAECAVESGWLDL